MIPRAQSLQDLLFSGKEYARLTASVRRGLVVSVSGVTGAARALFAAELLRRLDRLVVLVLADPDEKHALTGDLRALADLPAKSPLPLDLVRLASAPSPTAPTVIVTDFATLRSPAPQLLPDERQVITLEVGRPLAPDALVAWLEEAKYERVDLVTEPGEYAARGGIVDAFSDAQDAPVRCEFGETAIVSLRSFDPLSQRSLSQPAQAALATRFRPRPSDRSVAELLPESWLVVSEVPLEQYRAAVVISSGEDADFDLGGAPVTGYTGNLALLRSEVATSGLRYFIACATRERCERVAAILNEGEPAAGVEYIAGAVSAGFANRQAGCVLLTEREIYGMPLARPVRHRFRGVPVDSLVALRPGDHVVHVNYGIGLFEGTRRLAHRGAEKDYLVLRYRGNDRLYVPVESIGLLDRYIGAGDGPFELDRIGSRSWLVARARAARASAEYAAELLELEARRNSTRGFAFPADSEWQAQLEDSFPYTETPDQLAALAAVKQDMEKSAPMERLVSGDVGYGKTEIALRAALKAAAGMKQVAMLVPTTILCWQHYETFRRRLEPFPVRVEMLSRFVPPDRRKQIVTDIAAGRVDIVIGTHLMLGPAVRFRDLGLLIVDEEHKFGVRQKDRIRARHPSVDVLTLTATPVPRTLYLSLAGLRAISTVNTPPAGRREVLTEVATWSDELVVRYVERELARGGQVFFVHNRIASLPAITRRLERLLPGLDMVVAHGQMPERRLEDIYLGFASGEHRLLLSTAIIESGLDLPNVNTIIVDRADCFGLADLHQLRGRVGRSGRQAHALFVVPDRAELTPDARKRLSALLAYSRLGSGFRLALRDLEIRGAGDLLGTRQHGQVARVGLNLYSKMLKEASARLKGEPVRPEPELALDVEAYLPREYVADGFERVALYRRLLGVEDGAELEDFREELVDRFGRYPPEVEGLFKIARIRILARQKNLLRVEMKSDQATIVGTNRTARFRADLNLLLEQLERGEF